MQNNIDRAVQFQSFDALKGFKEALLEVERIVDEKKNLSEETFKELDLKLSKLKKGDKVIIKHYYNLEYIETHGIIKKVELIYHKLYLKNCIISFDDIIDIKTCLE